MKKSYLSAFTLSLLTISTVTHAYFQPDPNVKQSVRVGIGYSDTSLQNNTSDVEYGSGIKIEAGFDLNRIFGVQTSLEWNEDSQDIYIGGFIPTSVSVEGLTWKIGTDIGYQFDVSHMLQVKPYSVIGLTSYRQNIHSNFGSDRFDGTDIYMGFGVRGTSKQGLYAALEYNYTPEINTHSDMYQISATIGFKF